MDSLVLTLLLRSWAAEQIPEQRNGTHYRYYRAQVLNAGRIDDRNCCDRAQLLSSEGILSCGSHKTEQKNHFPSTFTNRNTI